MFYNAKDYPFLKPFTDNVDIIKNEFDIAVKNDPNLYNTFKSHALDNYTDHWVKDNGFHVNQIGYDLREKEGSYTAVAIYKKGFTINTFNIPLLFPKLTELLKTVKNPHYAAFVRISPLSTLTPHIHTRQHLVFHLLLNDLENGVCKFSCGQDEKKIEKKGDTVLFDYSFQHGTINEATNERINLVIDFNPFSNE